MDHLVVLVAASHRGRLPIMEYLGGSSARNRSRVMLGRAGDFLYADLYPE